jgi:hypothetical protein
LHSTSEPEPASQFQIVEGGKPGPKNRWQWIIVIMASVLLVIPCFWLPQIESFDLCSHIYNAWLSRLIADHHAPGLWIAGQSTNVLFDHVLVWLMTLLGSALAQRVAVGASVLLFFWSSFALVSVISGQRAWFLLPCLAILSYGRIYHYGFFNFYDSMAFGFLGLALLWELRLWRCLLAVPILALAWSAHPLPALWAVSMAAFCWIERKSGRAVQIALLSGSAAALTAIGIYERVRFRGVSGPNEGVGRKLLSVFGLDQILAFDHRFSVISYRSVELGMLAIFLLLLVQIVRKERTFGIPLQLYALACFACLVIPARRFYLYSAFQTPLGFITERFTLVASVLACCVIAVATPRMWQRVSLIVLAAIFFLAVYRDERSLSRIETKVDELVSSLPPLQRVAAMLSYPGAEDGFTENIVDRACVGRCYSYGNYEAPTQQFRIRATPGNRFILADVEDSARLSEGTYRVQESDLPLHQIYRCGPQTTDLCMRSLQAGELNGGLPRSARQ